MTRTFAIFLLLSFTLISCVSPAQDTLQPSEATKAPPGDAQKQLAELLPDPLPAQAVAQPAQTYGPETLYKYMDGGADAFLMYDFQLLLHQDSKAKDVDISADLFDMGTPENAFGIYASERSPTYHFIALGTEGYDNEGILNFVQGRYYVKLAAFGTDANVVLEQFAKAIAARIKDKPVPPDALQLFPTENRKPHSEQYLLKDPLGHPFLGPAYLATYSWHDQESTLLLSVAPDSADAQKRIELLAEHFRSSGQCEPAPELGDGAIRGSNSFEGKVIARARGQYVVILLNPAAQAESTFAEAVRRLP